MIIKTIIKKYFSNIDELSIWNTSLPSYAIKQHYERGVLELNKTGDVVAYVNITKEES